MGFFDPEDIQIKGKQRDLGNHQIDDKDLKKLLRKKKNVLLIEPNYPRKYMPSGLGRIASYIQKENNGQVTFARSHIRNKNFDLVCITSLFTYDAATVIKTINRSQNIYKDTPIIIGGVFASIMPEYIANTVETDNIRIFTGCSKFLDQYPIDYDIDWRVENEWKDFSYIFTTRGCPNMCGFCLVWRIEDSRIINNWKEQVNLAQPNIMICDNNLSSQPMEHIEDVTSFIKKYVSRASMLAYVLYNFNDTPKEADYRMSECNRLNVRPYPQRYVPLKTLNREEHYVGKHWTDNLAKAFRNFWIMPRLFKHQQFQDYIKDRKIQNKFHLTEKDISYYEGGTDGNQTNDSTESARKREERINRKRNNSTK